MQTECSDSKPSRLKSIGGGGIRLIYCFICRRRPATQDRPGASPLPLHLFSYADVSMLLYADVCCRMMTDGEVRKALKLMINVLMCVSVFESIRLKSCFHVHITANLIKSNLNKAPCSLAQQASCSLLSHTYHR